AGGEVYEGSLRSCLDFDLPHELMDGRELGRRFPAYRLPDELPVLLQPDGGFVLPERCIVAHVSGALAAGAVVRARERVVEWEDTRSGVRVTTDREVVEADRLVLTAGAWSQDVARLPPGLVRGVRQALAWLQPTRPDVFEPARFPVFNLSLDGEHFYGFPAFGIPGFKLGRYDHFGEGGDPDGIPREPTIDDETPLRAFAERYFPEGAGPAIAVKTCLFEPSPDEHFLLDRHPDSPHAVLGAGFSGHGFKFCSVVGEILADLALDGETRHDIGFLRLSRFD
ncbi:MAG: N-methyl-L-tryptophan oxidase, partial [Gaiellaceae bacterium]